MFNFKRNSPTDRTKPLQCSAQCQLRLYICVNVCVISSIGRPNTKLRNRRISCIESLETLFLLDNIT